MVPTVVSVEQTGLYRLRLRFEDGVEGELDIKEYLPFDGVFEPLKDPAYFAQVLLDEDAGTIVWPNGADLDPCGLHARVTGAPVEDEVAESACATLTARHVPSAREANSPLPLQAGCDVPEISRFYGIVVGMYFKDHARPHFHARYSGQTVVVEVRGLTVIKGSLPRRALALLMEWASKHQDELMQDWDLARAGKPLKKIAPLE